MRILTTVPRVRKSYYFSFTGYFEISESPEKLTDLDKPSLTRRAVRVDLNNYKSITTLKWGHWVVTWETRRR